MAYSYNIEEVPTEDAPHADYDIQQAKKFLQKHSTESGDSLYDHLIDLLAKILAERPKNAVDVFEEYSRKVKEEKFKNQSEHLQDQYVPPAQYEDAKKVIRLFQTVQQNGNKVEEEKLEEIEEEDEEYKMNQIPNMLDLLFYFEQANIGLPRSEMVLLNLAIRKLASEIPLQNIRFWGKILGNPKNYYVVEAELTEEDISRRLEMQSEIAVDQAEPSEIEEAKEAMDNKIAGKELTLVFPPLPVFSWKAPAEVPAERLGIGVNQKVYFVCNTPGLDEWIELPPVTPQQIVTARQIVRYCTGNLDTPIHSFPPFPGTERNYLRAQIARISSATHVSPVGFFRFGSRDEEEETEEEEEVEEGEGGTLSRNVHYEPLPIKDLTDPSMTNWCHHSEYILKQGRTTWWNPEKPEEDVDEELEEEEIEDDETRATQLEKEVGPPLLTPLSEDAIQDSITPWTVIQSSHIEPDLAIAVVRSNTWPGAFAFASGKNLANVYIGTGHKYIAFNYSPPNMPSIQEQYPIGPEIMECQDPTAEEEETYRIAHLPPEPIDVDDEEQLETDEDDEDYD